MNIYKSLSFLLFTLFSTLLFSCSCNEQKNKSEEIDSWETPIDVDTIIDLPQIKVAYKNLYKKKLTSFVKLASFYSEEFLHLTSFVFTN